jgi:hypothetical protein
LQQTLEDGTVMGTYRNGEQMSAIDRLWTGLAGSAAGAGLGFAFAVALMIVNVPLDTALWSVYIGALIGCCLGLAIGDPRRV